MGCRLPPAWGPCLVMESVSLGTVMQLAVISRMLQGGLQLSLPPLTRRKTIPSKEEAGFRHSHLPPLGCLLFPKHSFRPHPHHLIVHNLLPYSGMFLFFPQACVERRGSGGLFLFFFFFIWCLTPLYNNTPHMVLPWLL